MMLIKFLHLQIPKRHRLEQLPDLRKSYNKSEKINLFMYVAAVVLYALIQFFIDNEIRLFYV